MTNKKKIRGTRYLWRRLFVRIFFFSSSSFTTVTVERHFVKEEETNKRKRKKRESKESLIHHSVRLCKLHLDSSVPFWSSLSFLVVIQLFDGDDTSKPPFIVVWSKKGSLDTIENEAVSSVRGLSHSFCSLNLCRFHWFLITMHHNHHYITLSLLSTVLFSWGRRREEEREREIEEEREEERKRKTLERDLNIEVVIVSDWMKGTKKYVLRF